MWSPEMAYVLGYFAADGSMIKNNHGGYYIEFTSTDRTILEQVCRVSNSSHKISERPLRNEVWKRQYRVQVGSRYWFNDLSVRLDSLHGRVIRSASRKYRVFIEVILCAGTSMEMGA